ncbi:hypothetical protein [Yunchengibacter salinarum]|uniref:hypothetical protein n=1 Tax=Yunchengibacter salinarum TaxID=3133399 RepID=UPI0035B6356A
MSDNRFIDKRRKKRGASGLAIRAKHILMLILVSLVAYGAFRYWVGRPQDSLCDGPCDPAMDPTLAVGAFFAMLIGVALIGAGLGLVLALIRRSRPTGGLSSYLAPPNEPAPDESDMDQPDENTTRQGEDARR